MDEFPSSDRVPRGLFDYMGSSNKPVAVKSERCALTLLVASSIVANHHPDSLGKKIQPVRCRAHYRHSERASAGR